MARECHGHHSAPTPFGRASVAVAAAARFFGPCRVERRSTFCGAGLVAAFRAAEAMHLRFGPAS
eukprot:4675639-Alexandrium_andersonii.AAC.1